MESADLDGLGAEPREVPIPLPAVPPHPLPNVLSGHLLINLAHVVCSSDGHRVNTTASAAVFAPVFDQSFAHVLALSARLFHNDALLLVLVKGVRRARSRAALDRRFVVLVCRFQLIRKAQPLSTE